MSIWVTYPWYCCIVCGQLLSLHRDSLACNHPKVMAKEEEEEAFLEEVAELQDGEDYSLEEEEEE